ncbi:hypothetical protein M2318_004837 [Metapseudomonas resinovorans]|uniref:hypothetical protein n=1 Tax=Metapseudomonas resinovorans TaxID=53412 RepID=UPI003D233EA0
MQPARLDLPIIQGATLRQILRIMQPLLAYRPITAIASTSPVRLTVAHGLPTDWPVWIRGVTGLPALNREVARQLPHLALVVDADHLDINSVPATGLLPKGGELSYYLPVDLTGATANLVVLSDAGTELLSLAPTVHAGGWVEVVLTDEETEALTWVEGNWSMDLTFPNGETLRAFTGAAKVYPVGSVPSGQCESGWVLAAGGQGAPGIPGPVGPAFQVDASGPLSTRDLYDDEAEGFAFLATDTGDLYLREGAPGGWSAGVPFQGPAGEDGTDGRSITSVAVNGVGHLIITYSDGTTSDAGAIPAAPAMWGVIGGVLLDQVDLATALAGKATAAQGAKADTAVQPGSLAPVATSGSYDDLQDKPFIPATAGDVGAATAAQGALADTAVQPTQLATELDEKVDKLDGYGLSQENFTAAEKSKLAGLESSHFKGLFASLAALQAAFPTAVAGDYADVDIGVGVDVQRFLWDPSDAEWVIQASGGGSMTPAEVKAAYESNPDTNAFSDAEQAKLAGVEAGATANADTDELPEGASNLYFTAARVLATVLSGFSLATGGAVVSTDSVLVAIGKLQRQLNDHVGAGGGAHADVVAGGSSGFMTGAQAAKLAGIATGATANDTDANLKDRANHTGSQAISTVTGLQSALDKATFAPVLTESTTARTAVLGDAGSYLRFTNGGASTYTVAPQADVAWSADAEIHIRRGAAANLTLTPGSGVTLNAPSGGTLVMTNAMSVTLKRVAENVWDVIGQTVAL